MIKPDLILFGKLKGLVKRRPMMKSDAFVANNKANDSQNTNEKVHQLKVYIKFLVLKEQF